MNSKEHFTFLLSLYLDDNISLEQKTLFYELLETNQYDDLLSDDVLDKLNIAHFDSRDDLSKSTADQLFDTIVLPENQIPKSTFYKKLVIYIGSAAAVISLLFATWLFYDKDVTNGGNDFVDINSDYIEYYNPSDSIQKLILNDNSIVSIYPNSKLKYPKEFLSKTRTVSLTGKAFFEVSKDSIHPFVVNSENIVVKVLGTSFLINADAVKGSEEVEVRSGLVQVEKKGKKDVGNGSVLLVTPNQKVVYAIKEDNLTKTLVSAPLQLLEEERPENKKINVNSFNYKGQKLTAIFKELEEVYGIQIVIPNKSLENCVFTGNLSGADLFTKLQILCVATQTNYKTLGTDVIIEGKGCIN